METQHKWTGRPEDDPARQRAEGCYDTLEDWERRGIVQRTMRPLSGPSGQPSIPPRFVVVSDVERIQAAFLYRGFWIGYDLPPARARDWRVYRQAATRDDSPAFIASSERECFEAIDRLLDGNENEDHRSTTPAAVPGRAISVSSLGSGPDVSCAVPAGESPQDATESLCYRSQTVPA